MKNAGRFQQPSAWIRLVALGVLLIDLAVLSFVNIFHEARFSGYWPGMGAMFGGLLTGIICVRLSRPVFYLDWLLAAALHTAVGLALSNDPTLAAKHSFAMLLATFAALAAMRIWIGVTMSPRRGGAWLTASGAMTLLFAAWILFDGLPPGRVTVDFVIATDLLISGLATVGVGLALRPASTIN